MPGCAEVEYRETPMAKQRIVSGMNAPIIRPAMGQQIQRLAECLRCARRADQAENAAHLYPLPRHDALEQPAQNISDTALSQQQYQTSELIKRDSPTR